jgi:dihydrofolate reductase
MRKLVATVFNYSLNGLVPEHDSDDYQFCMELPDDPADEEQSLDFIGGADAHIMGRVAYEGMAAAAKAVPDHPAHTVLTPAPKVVFSRTMETADWANTTVAAGDTAEEIDRLKRGGDGYIVVWGGYKFWRSLMHLDLIDELHLDMFPYLAAEGIRLFEDVPKSYRFELISSTPWSNGTVELRYRRPRA